MSQENKFSLYEFISKLHKRLEELKAEDKSKRKLDNKSALSQELKSSGFPNSSRNDFIQVIKDYINKVSKKKATKFFTKLNEILHAIYNSAGIQQRMVEIRQAITTEYLNDPAYKIMLYDRVKKTAEIKESRRKVAEKQRNRIPVNIQQILNIHNSLKRDDDVYDKILALMLSSGCRQVEILDGYFKFKKPANDNKNIVQNDVAKSKDEYMRKVKKPLLNMTALEFKNKLKDVREQLDTSELTREEMATKYNKYVNERVVRAFEGVNIGKQSSHSLRKLYVVISYHLFARPEESIDSYAQRVLGHDGDMATKNYTIYYIPNNTEVKTDEIKANITELKQEVREVKDDLKEQKDGNYNYIIRKRQHRRNGVNDRKTPLDRNRYNKTKLEEIIDAGKEILNNGLNITNARLRQAGFGSRIITEFNRWLETAPENWSN